MSELAEEKSPLELRIDGAIASATMLASQFDAFAPADLITTADAKAIVSGKFHVDSTAFLGAPEQRERGGGHSAEVGFKEGLSFALEMASKRLKHAVEQGWTTAENAEAEIEGIFAHQIDCYVEFRRASRINTLNTGTMRKVAEKLLTPEPVTQ